MKGRTKGVIVSVYVLYLLLFLHLHRSTRSSHMLFRDVRQGDSISIHSEGNTLLIDGGPSHEDFVYFPQKLCPVEAVLLTHPHSDHLFGLNRVLKLCSLDIAYSNPVDYDSSSYEEFQELTEKIDKRELYRGDVFTFGAFSVYVLWPPKDLPVSEDVNESSIVLLLDYGDFEVLLTGDISSQTQRQLGLAAYAHLIQDGIDVYKLPHHGSRYSFDKGFLLSLRPKVAVVSLGENSFGHPSPLFIDFFEEQNIPLYRTDLHGDIRISFKETL